MSRALFYSLLLGSMILMSIGLAPSMAGTIIAKVFPWAGGLMLGFAVGKGLGKSTK